MRSCQCLCSPSSALSWLVGRMTHNYWQQTTAAAEITESWTLRRDWTWLKVPSQCTGWEVVKYTRDLYSQLYSRVSSSGGTVKKELWLSNYTGWNYKEIGRRIISWDPELVFLWGAIQLQLVILGTCILCCSLTRALALQRWVRCGPCWWQEIGAVLIQCGEY